MKKILTIIALTFMFSIFYNNFVLADESGKEERKYYEEQEREARKYREEQEREERKHRQEQEREAQKHRKEMHKENSKKWKHDDRKDKYLSKERGKYRYYPSKSVYYDEEEKVYFYLDGDKWGVSVRLPNGITVGGHNFVTVEAPKGRPYNDYHEHNKKYGQ